MDKTACIIMSINNFLYIYIQNLSTPSFVYIIPAFAILSPIEYLYVHIGLIIILILSRSSNISANKY